MFQKLFKFFQGKQEDLFGRSGKWQTLRKNFLEKHDRCSACGSKNKDLEIHHIKPYHENPELELDENNLITLCADPCHIVFGHLMNFRSWNPNVVKDCEDYYNKVVNRPS